MKRTVLARLCVALGLTLVGACESVTVPVPSGDVRLTIVAAGDTQTAMVNTTVAAAPSVRVGLPNGRPVAGRSVMFAQVRGSNTSMPQTVETGPDGIATMSAWTLGSRGGIQEVVAFVVGATTDARVSFFANAVAGPVASATLSPGFSAINVGESVLLSLTLRDAQLNLALPPTPVVYLSSDTLVARVNNSGVVTASAYGSAAITATTGTFSRTVTVAVRAAAPSVPVVTSSAVLGVQLGRAVVTPTGAGIVVEDGGRRVFRVNLTTLALQDSLVLSQALAIGEIALTPSGNRLYLAQGNGLTIVDVPTWSELRTISLPSGVTALAASPAGDYIYATQSGGLLYRISTANDAVTSLNISGVLRGVAAHPTADRVYVTSAVGALHEINTSLFSLNRSVFFADSAGRVHLSPNGERIFVSRNGALTEARNRVDLGAIRAIPQSTSARSLVFGTAGRYLALLAGASEVRIHDAATYELLYSIPLLLAAHLVTDPVSGNIFVISSQGVIHRVTIFPPP